MFETKIKHIAIKSFNFSYYFILMEFILGITSLLPNIKISNQIRGFLIRPFFKKCGKNFQLAKRVIINYPRNIEIGDNVYLAHNIWINGTGGLKIGNGVIISPGVVIATTKHLYENQSISKFKSKSAPIVIGDGTWITSNCVITMNTRIGKGCIIGACSSVTSNIPDYTFAGGVPATFIKSLE